MNDFERVKSEKYAMIANSFLKDKNLSNKAKGVLAMILALPDNWDFSIKGMVSITKDGEASLRSAINEMKDNGYCAMKPIRINNKIARWKYLFSGEKLTEKLLCDFLQVENLNVENQAQYNNNEYNCSNTSIPTDKKENKKRLSNDNQKSDCHQSQGESLKTKRFVKPTVEQIAAYIAEKGFHFDAEYFFDFYESKGWKVGKNNMKDWKAACRTWEAMRKKDQKEKEGKEEDAPLTKEQMKEWQPRQFWFLRNTPRIAGKICFRDFMEMKELTGSDAMKFKDIILMIEQSDYEGDILPEFRRIHDLMTNVNL